MREPEMVPTRRLPLSFCKTLNGTVKARFFHFFSNERKQLHAPSLFEKLNGLFVEGQSEETRDTCRVGAALDEHLEPLVVIPVDQRSRVELHQNVFHGDWLSAIDRLIAEEVLNARLGDLSAAVQEDSHLFQVARLGRVKERSLLTGSRLHVGVRAAVEKLDELAGRIIVVHANRVDGCKALAVELIDRLESPLVLRVRGGLVHDTIQ